MIAALMTPALMGFAPVFGKLAIRSGLDPYTLAALRTCAAAAILWIVYLLFFRKYIYIFPAGLLATMAVGTMNGLGSLLYYNGLLLLDNASLSQLLNMLYVVFVMLLTRLYGHHVSRISLFRAGLALAAVYFLTATNSGRGHIHWLGVGLMIGSAFTYAYHVILGQRGMYEMPAPTMALYALTWMALTVLLARLFLGRSFAVPWAPALPVGWWYLLGLTAVTALSRVTLFAGVRNLGALHTILLNVAELGVTLLVANLWLAESLTPMQWVGVLILLASVLLSRWDTQVRDASYGPLLQLAPFGGLSRNQPITPDRFSTVSRVYRRKSRADMLKELEKL
jgi:drug/metabolite transporter (DMT)-like permease